MTTVFEPVIGLECHVQLHTRSKLLSSAGASFGAAPNTHCDPFTLALPGTLPVVNEVAIAHALRMALAVGATVRRASRFARKHYFYPDSPKGFQTTQFDEPICEGGHLDFVFEGALRRVPLTRIHLEEDAGKSMHSPRDSGEPVSLVDLNRAGVPLIEVVSEPALRSASEAAEYLRALRQLVRWLGGSDGNMEEGSLRCDANVSLRSMGSQALGTRAELKNINSFRNVERAIEVEIARQTRVLLEGGRVIQETRLFDAERGTTAPMRSKEDAHDYRYFPEPDLPPLVIDEPTIDAARHALPELPLARHARYVATLGLSLQDATLLASDRAIADYFEGVLAAGADAKRAANWMATELLARLNRDALPVDKSPIAPPALAELVRLVDAGTLSGKMAKSVFDQMWSSQLTAAEIVQRDGLAQVSDEAALMEIVTKVLKDNSQQVTKYQKGAVKLLGFFVGQVMKLTGGRAHPELVNTLVKKALDDAQ